MLGPNQHKHASQKSKKTWALKTPERLEKIVLSYLKNHGLQKS